MATVVTNIDDQASQSIYAGRVITATVNVPAAAYEKGQIVTATPYVDAGSAGAETRTVISLETKTTTGASSPLVAVVSGEVSSQIWSAITDLEKADLAKHGIWVREAL